MQLLFYAVCLLLVVAGVDSRDLLKQPFANWSIWNLPIGADAKYVPARIKQATGAGMAIDPDILTLDVSAPVTPVYENKDGWSGKSRCTIEGGALFKVPFPSHFVVPGASGHMTPNNAGAHIDEDGKTLHQAQPITHCTVSGPVTAGWLYPSVLIDGDGIPGAHGGSGLSSIGGTLRLGELVPNAPPIRHALKVEFDARTNYYRNPCFRWPASKCDSDHSFYGGTVPSLTPGSLLALPATLDISKLGLETKAALMLAWTFQNYGAYVVDDTAWNVYSIAVETSPIGSVADEFQREWEFPVNPSSRGNAWSRDMDRIFLALNVVDNWNLVTYQRVKASNGAEGAGGGKPLQPWIV